LCCSTQRKLSQEPAALTEKRSPAVSAPDENGSYYIDLLGVFTAGENDVLLDRTPIPGQKNDTPYGGYAALLLRIAKYNEGPAIPWQRVASGTWESGQQGPLGRLQRQNCGRRIRERGNF